jgi:hypothetical protein
VARDALKIVETAAVHEINGTEIVSDRVARDRVVDQALNEPRSVYAIKHPELGPVRGQIGYNVPGCDKPKSG